MQKLHLKHGNSGIRAAGPARPLTARLLRSGGMKKYLRFISRIQSLNAPKAVRICWFVTATRRFACLIPFALPRRLRALFKFRT